jgi:acyl-CoA reductase-like NAD-dependent aldehyde dehydrogenase
MGGKRNENFSGYFYEPTLVSDVNLDMSLATEEIFGPIASIIK